MPDIAQYDKINALTNMLCDRIDEVLSYFDITYKRFGKTILAPCYIHGGDNPTAFNLYPDGDTVRGIWSCNTHHCEQKYKKTLLGFIRGALQVKNKKDISFYETIQFSLKLLNLKSLDEVLTKSKDELTRRNLTLQSNKLHLIPKQTLAGWTRWRIRNLLKIPSDYYAKRGFTAQILDRYDVGLYQKLNRVAVPIYSDNYKQVVGFTARSLYEKCPLCKLYHNKSEQCPTDDNRRLASKWIHSQGFAASESLYNLWFANSAIKHSGKVILVESPGNVWKLVQNGVENCVAIYGSHLSETQHLLLSMSGAHTVMLLYDNDEAGKSGAQNAYAQLCRDFHVYSVNFEIYNDVADMSDEYFKENILKLLT